MVERDPMYQRRRLRIRLRQAREQAGMRQKDVAVAMDWSLSKLLRIEAGTVGISVNDLKILLQYYGITDPQDVASLVDMARVSYRELGWWSPYREAISAQFQEFLGHESSASQIRNFEPLMVPGLLQTEEYAAAVLANYAEPHTQRLLELRKERQEKIFRTGEKELHFILDENVISRTVGDKRVMRQQLRMLQEVISLPHVTLRIIPFSAGVYPYWDLPYVIFEFPVPDDGAVLYIERAKNQTFITNEGPGERGVYSPARFLEKFWQLEQLATLEDAPRMVDRALGRFLDEPN